MPVVVVAMATLLAGFSPPMFARLAGFRTGGDKSVIGKDDLLAAGGDVLGWPEGRPLGTGWSGLGVTAGDTLLSASSLLFTSCSLKSRREDPQLNLGASLNE